MAKRTPRSIRLSDPEWAAVDDLAIKDDVSKAHIVRQAVKAYAGAKEETSKTTEGRRNDE